MQNIKFTILFFLALSAKIFAKEPAWELLTMTPPRGEISSYFICDNKIYIAGNNIFVSSNFGDSWNWIYGINIPHIIEVNDVIYSGLAYLDSLSHIILKPYKSYDGGKTWIEIFGPWDKTWGLSFLGNYGETIIGVGSAGLGGDNYFYTSSDEGNTWELKGILIDTIGVKGFTVFSVSKNIIMTFADLYSHYPLMSGSNIYLSLDTGRIWHTILFDRKISIISLYIKSSTEIYATTTNGIWLSIDTCKTWFQKYLINDNIINFAISEDKKNLIASSYTGGVLYSTDSGNKWDTSYEFKNFVNTRGIFSSNYLFFNNQFGFLSFDYLGNFRSSDFGDTWEEKNNGFSTIKPSDFIILPNNDMYISHYGIFKSENSGKIFSFKGMRDLGFQALTYNKKGYIFAGTGQGNSIYRSKDGGATWDSFYPLNTGIIAIITDNNGIIYAAIAAGNVIISSDDGETWIDTDAYAAYLGVNDEGHIFSFSYGDIYRSTDEGVTWEQLAYTEVDPTYIEYGGRIIFNNKTKTAAYYDLMTTDNGRAWFKQSDVGYRFGTTSSASFAVDSTYNWIYAGDYPHILRSTDNGLNWYSLDSTGLKTNSFGQVAVSPDGHIYVFGSTGGLYRSRDAYVSVKEPKPEDHIQIQNYPNPVSEKTEIVVNLKQPGQLRLSVFDCFGKLCETKSYGWQDSGETTILLDTDNYPSGVYFCRIECGEQREMKAFNVIK